MAMTAQAVIDSIKTQIGPDWKDTPVDDFIDGNPNTEVTGIVTTYAPSLQVLENAVESGKNLIISRESPYWSRMRSQRRPGTGGFGPDTRPSTAGAAPDAPDSLAGDPVYDLKSQYIADNGLVIYRFFDNWSARQPDPQLQGLAKALGWQNYYQPSGGFPWGSLNGFFEIPPASLRETAQNIKQQLNLQSIRVGGNPDITIRKVAVHHGMYWLTDLQTLLAEPDVDLVVMGEPQWENELCQYSFDLDAAGVRKGLILLGQQASEEPGCGEMADWLKTFVADIPIEWIPAGEPAWMPYTNGELS